MNLLDDSQRILVEHYEDDFEPTEEGLFKIIIMLYCSYSEMPWLLWSPFN